MNEITATDHLNQLSRAPHVIVLTTFHLDDYVFAALRAGASGFLLKDTAPTDIASHLYMSEATVKAHVSRLLTKLQATNRVQVAIVVHDAGLV